MPDDKGIKKCTKRPVTATEQLNNITVTSVDDFGFCIGDECAHWTKARLPMGATSNVPQGGCGLGGDRFPNPTYKPESSE